MIFASVYVRPRSFLHYRLQRHMMLRRDSPAVLVLRRVIRDGPVHAGDLDANLAPLNAYALPTPGQRLPRFFPATNSQSGGLRKYQLSQFLRIFRFAEYG